MSQPSPRNAKPFQGRHNTLLQHVPHVPSGEPIIKGSRPLCPFTRQHEPAIVGERARTAKAGRPKNPLDEPRAWRHHAIVAATATATIQQTSSDAAGAPEAVAVRSGRNARGKGIRVKRLPKALAKTMGQVSACLGGAVAIGGLFWLLWNYLVVGLWPGLEPHQKLYGGIFVIVLTVPALAVVVYCVRQHSTAAAAAKKRQELQAIENLAMERDERKIVRDLWEPMDFCHNPLVPSACLSITKLHLLSYYEDVIQVLEDALADLHLDLSDDSNPNRNSAEGHRRAANFALGVARGQLDNKAARRLVGRFLELEPLVQKVLDICTKARIIYDALNAKEAKAEDGAAERAIGNAREKAAALLAYLEEVRRFLSGTGVEIRTDANHLRGHISRVCAPTADSREFSPTPQLGV